MTGCLRWSCRLATWMIVLRGLAGVAQAGLPSATTMPLGPLPEDQAVAADPQPAEEWLAQPSGLDGGCLDGACLDGACCDCSCPAWVASAGAIFLGRSSPDDDVLYLDTTRSMRGSAFDFGWQSGFQVELGRRNINNGDDIVARLFMVDGWTADAVASFPGDVQVNSVPPVIVLGPRDLSTRMTSELSSFELNYYCQSAWGPAVKWIVGLRTVELDESLGTAMVNPGGGVPAVSHTVEVQNRLWGAQLGTQVKILEASRLSLTGMLTAGIYGNSAAQRSAVWEDQGAAFYVADRHDVASFVGETGIGGAYRLTNWLTLRADYRVLWVSGTALASEQVPVSNFVSGRGIDVDSNAFYHGAFVGLDWSF